ncbi:MAG TPA: NAD(P)-dependent oxidoreductase [Verrucomicrobiae bacterium]|nr:NAD(P)-dependent oxidoreductase [Verrucomicrobiae bacterium]
MKVLLTGGNGFVGSHVLDQLLAQGIPTVVLLRAASDRQFIANQLSRVEVRTGGMDQPEALAAALAGVTHVVHCAGATKALDAAGFFAANQQGTRQLVEAVNRCGPRIQRFVHVSSLAVAGPHTPDEPARENQPPRPVSDYGRSKLAAEQEVMTHCTTDWVILRPPAVYGPRDREFLRLFKAVNAHLRPQFGGGRQFLSLVHVADLARVIVAVLIEPRARRKVFFVGSPEVVTAAELARRMATELGTWTIPLPLPRVVLWLACQWADWRARRTRRPSVLNAQKFAELNAPGWVCDVARLKAELDLECATPLRDGVVDTLRWYREHGWL